MIEFITCSVTPSKVDRLRASLDWAMGNEAWSLRVVDDATSLASGYNVALTKRTPGAEMMVLLHDDVWFLRSGLADDFRAALQAADIVGVAGTRRVSSMAWTSSDHPHVYGAYLHPDGAAAAALHVVAVEDWETAGMQSLDGCILVCRPEVFERVQFDADTFDGWHGYDADFTYRAYLLGYRLAVSVRFAMVHASEGTFDSGAWRRFYESFAAKHALVPERSGWSNAGTIQRGLPESVLSDRWPSLLPRFLAATEHNRQRFLNSDIADVPHSR